MKVSVNPDKPTNVPKQCEVYTDGACSGNPGPGGWSAIIVDANGVQKILKGSSAETTNNQMELTAFIEALSYLKNKNVKITVYSDSKYLVDGITKWLSNWKKRHWQTSDGKPVKNIGLWQKIDTLLQNKFIELKWVKGHSHNHYNELADKIAVEQIPRNFD
jgi:ribonuclease HI